MLEDHDISLDQEMHQLEVATFEIEDLAEVEQIAAGSTSTSSTSTCSATTSSGSTAAMQPAQADR